MIKSDGSHHAWGLGGPELSLLKAREETVGRATGVLMGKGDAGGGEREGGREGGREDEEEGLRETHWCMMRMEGRVSEEKRR